MYEGEVFTFRNDRAPRTATSGRQQRPAPAPDYGRPEAQPGADRTARLEGRVARLEESLAHLSGVIQHLTEALEAAGGVQPVRTKGAPEPEPAAWAPGAWAPGADAPGAEAPKVTVQVQPLRAEDPPAPPPSDVKVTLFAGSSAEAILGHVKVTHQ